MAAPLCICHCNDLVPAMLDDFVSGSMHAFEKVLACRTHLTTAASSISLCTVLQQHRSTVLLPLPGPSCLPAWKLSIRVAGPRQTSGPIRIYGVCMCVWVVFGSAARKPAK